MARAPDPRVAASLSGFAQSVGYLVATTGPLAVGFLHSAIGGWTVPVVVLLVITGLQLMAGWPAARDVTLPAGAGRAGRPVALPGAGDRFSPSARRGERCSWLGWTRSTQSTKVLLCQAEDGTIVGRGSAPHPPGTECDPAAWWSALEQAGQGLLGRADAIAVAAQQHGMVVVDKAGQVIRPALLWNDLRSAAAARELIAELGGPGWWAEHTGSVPSASFTVTKLRWLAGHEPENAARVARVMLPHDWLTWRLASQGPGRGGAGGAGPVTDRGDASGTGYFSPAAGRWLPEVAAAALGHEPSLPRIAKPHEVVGETAGGAVLAPGTGDNMGAALGLGLEPGELVISIGTSGTAYAVTGSGPRRMSPAWSRGSPTRPAGSCR